MEFTFTTVLGLCAGALTTFAIVPQVLKAWKTRQTKDLSLPMFILLDVGVFLWLIYGLLIGELPVIAANVIGCVLVSTILILKLRFG